MMLLFSTPHPENQELTMSAYWSVRLLITSADNRIFTITSTLVMDAEYLATKSSIRPSRYRAVCTYSTNKKATASSLVFAAGAMTAARFITTSIGRLPSSSTLFEGVALFSPRVQTGVGVGVIPLFEHLCSCGSVAVATPQRRNRCAWFKLAMWRLRARLLG